MHTRDYRDIISGVILCALGLFVAYYAATHYNMGTLRRMGSGMFPTALGCILAIFGALIAIPALYRQGKLPTVDVRPALAILASVGVFAATVDVFGMVVAVTLLCFVAVLSEQKFHGLRTVKLAAGLSLASVLIFNVGLGMPIPIFAWPF